MLGLGHERGSGTEVRVGLRKGGLRYVSVALGGVGVVTLLLGLLRVLEANPADAFDLLRAWGPNFFIALMVTLLLGGMLGGLLTQLMETSRDGVAAQQRMAEAMSQIAQKDDRQAEEVRRLAVYAGRELGAIAERMDRQDDVMQQVAASLQGLHTRLSERHRG
jgi:hypothetical protein